MSQNMPKRYPTHHTKCLYIYIYRERERERSFALTANNLTLTSKNWALTEECLLLKLVEGGSFPSPQPEIWHVFAQDVPNFRSWGSGGYVFKGRRVDAGYVGFELLPRPSRAIVIKRKIPTDSPAPRDRRYGATLAQVAPYVGSWGPAGFFFK